MVKVIAKLDPARTQFQLKVTLLYIRPAIWRRLLVPANIEMPQVSPRSCRPPSAVPTVSAMADPQHPERERLLEWLGQPYDPEAFDLDAVNA